MAIKQETKVKRVVNKRTSEGGKQQEHSRTKKGKSKRVRWWVGSLEQRTSTARGGKRARGRERSRIQSDGPKECEKKAHMRLFGAGLLGRRE